MAQATNKRTTSSLNPQARCCSRWGLQKTRYVTISAVSSYLTFSPLPFTRRLFSVALSLRFPSLDVIQHHCSMEPGLSSYAAFRPCYTRLSNLLLFILTFLCQKSSLLAYFSSCLFSSVSCYIFNLC